MKQDDAQEQLRQAGKALHDEVAPLLVVSGLRLQLLRMDHPQAADQVNDLLEILDEAMERIRKLSQELNPSPVAVPGGRAGKRRVRKK